MSKEKIEYISLKEAAEMSGYTADYLGQLIRSGKLKGKQVFLNVAWMTTRESVEDYMKKDKKEFDLTGYSLAHLRKWLFSIEGVTVVYEIVTWSVILVFGVFILFLAYVFSVNLDHRIEQEHMKKWQPKSVYVP